MRNNVEHPSVRLGSFSTHYQTVPPPPAGPHPGTVHPPNGPHPVPNGPHGMATNPRRVIQTTPGVIHQAPGMMIGSRNRSCPFYPGYNTRVSSQHNLVGAGFVSQGKFFITTGILHFLGISMDSQPRGFHYHSPNNTLGGQAAILTQVRQAPIHHSVIQNNNSYIQNIQFNPSPAAHG